MKFFPLFLFFLARPVLTEKWSIYWKSGSPVSVHMDETIDVPFSVTIPDIVPFPAIKLSVENNNPDIIDAILPEFRIDETNRGIWNSSVNVTGLFIGSAEMTLILSADEDRYISDEIRVTATRAYRLIDTLFTASVAALVSLLYVNFGCLMDWSVCRDIPKRPVGIAIGAFCQFVAMPLIAYTLGQLLFSDKPEMQIGIFFTGISPSGGASNIWTVLLGGNINLSVTMTTLGTLASFATMPLWIFTLGKRILEKGNLGVPYSKIAFLALGLIVPLSLGYLIQRKMPKLSRALARITRPFSIILILFIVIFGIVTNLYLFKLFSWQIVVAGMGLAWIGYIIGFVAMLVFKQPIVDVKAIAIETGIQNTGIAIFLLRLGLTQPAADLTTVIPVSCAVMTPIPLTLIWIVKLLQDRQKRKRADLADKLRRLGEPIDATRPTTPNTKTMVAATVLH